MIHFRSNLIHSTCVFRRRFLLPALRLVVSPVGVGPLHDRNYSFHPPVPVLNDGAILGKLREALLLEEGIDFNMSVVDCVQFSLEFSIVGLASLLRGLFCDRSCLFK